MTDEPRPRSRPPIHPDRAHRAAALAGHRGDEQTARRLLGHVDGTVVATAIGALSRMGRLTAADLSTAAGDRRPEVRRRGADEAGRHPELDAPLAGLLDDGDATVVEVAAWACGERRPDEALVSKLAELATAHDDALVREASVAALGALGVPDGREAILAATRDKASVRRRAVLALAPFDGPEVEAALATALTDRDWQVRQAAEDLTGNS